MIKVICKECKKDFFVSPSRIKKGRGKYCSRDCRDKNNHGKPPVGDDQKCVVCGSSFHVKPHVVKIGSGKFCSNYCKNRYRKGRKATIRSSKIAVCRNCGKEFYVYKSVLEKKNYRCCSKKCFDDVRRKVELRNKAWNWKGEFVGYTALHHWVRRYLGKAEKCENPDCIYPRKNSLGKVMLAPKRYEWANISGKYHRDKSDWMQLCSSCHKKFDSNDHSF